jgi:uncharacterized protein related to proFAR isomerase
MNIELATTDDIVNELRKRGMRFVFIGALNTNIKASGPIMVVSQAVDRKDVFRLISLGVDELLHTDDDRIELDQEG